MLIALPRPLAVFEDTASRQGRKEREGKGREGKGREGEGREAKGKGKRETKEGKGRNTLADAPPPARAKSCINP